MKESVSLTWRRIPERYRMEGTMCQTCGEKFFPKRSVCPNCRRKGKIVDFKFKGTGEVYSYTYIHAAAEGFEKQVPYYYAIIKLDEGPMISGQVIDVGPDEMKIGVKVEAVMRKIQQVDPNGLIHYGFKFRIRK